MSETQGDRGAPIKREHVRSRGQFRPESLLWRRQRKDIRLEHSATLPDDGRPRTECRTHRPGRRFHWLWNVPPCGAGKSRLFVQPAAKGSEPNRPFVRPAKAMTGIAIDVANR